MKKRVSKSFTLLINVSEELEKKAKKEDLATSRYLEKLLIKELNIELPTEYIKS